MVEESAFQVKALTIMSVPHSEGSISLMSLPDKPVVEILGTDIAGRDNPEGFGIPRGGFFRRPPTKMGMDA